MYLSTFYKACKERGGGESVNAGSINALIAEAERKRQRKGNSNSSSATASPISKRDDGEVTSEMKSQVDKANDRLRSLSLFKPTPSSTPATTTPKPVKSTTTSQPITPKDEEQKPQVFLEDNTTDAKPKPRVKKSSANTSSSVEQASVSAPTVSKNYEDQGQEVKSVSTKLISQREDYTPSLSSSSLTSTASETNSSDPKPKPRVKKDSSASTTSSSTTATSAAAPVTKPKSTSSASAVPPASRYQYEDDEDDYGHDYGYSAPSGISNTSYHDDDSYVAPKVVSKKTEETKPKSTNTSTYSSTRYTSKTEEEPKSYVPQQETTSSYVTQVELGENDPKPKPRTKKETHSTATSSLHVDTSHHSQSVSSQSSQSSAQTSHDPTPKKRVKKPDSITSATFSTEARYGTGSPAESHFMEVISDKLLLGDETLLENLGKLSELNITHILLVDELAQSTDAKYPKLFTYNIFNMPNDPKFELFGYFDDFCDLIVKAFKQNKAAKWYICDKSEATSLAPTIVLAYLMRERNMTLDKALQLLQSKKSKIKPNRGFMEQLEDFNADLEDERNGA